MWVRTQGNNMLIDCNTFKLVTESRPMVGSYRTEDHYLITNDITQGYPLADYPTAEQAFKVLDMLQEHLWMLERTRSSPTMDYSISVFKFPFASEVKVDK